MTRVSRLDNQQAEEGSARLERAALVSVLVTAMLGALKGVFALLSGSVGLMAEAVHSGADALTDAAVLAGLKISRRKSASFPYGLYKVENLVALVVAGVIFVTAYEIGREAILTQARQVTHIGVSIAALVLAIAVTLALARYKLRVGRAFNSPSLIADGKHSYVDALASVVVIIGLVGAWYNLPLDRVAALVVLVLIVRLGWQTLVDAARVLLDASLDRQTLDRVRAIIKEEPAVREIAQLAGRNSGRFRFIEADLILRVRDLEKAARIAGRIEHRIREQVGHVDHIALRYEPMRKEVWRYAVPLDDREGAISAHFGEAPLFALADVRASDRRLLDLAVVANPYVQLEKGKGIRASEFLVEQDMDYLVLRERTHGRGPEYVLRDAGVELEKTSALTLAAALDELGVAASPQEVTQRAAASGGKP